MRNYWIFFCAALFSTTLWCEPVSLGGFKDRLIAVVEKQPITESDLVKRFELYSQIYPVYSGKKYADVRKDLLEELCLDQIHDLLWAKLTHDRPVDITDSQLDSFFAQYPTLKCERDTLKKAYSSWVKRDQLARHMVHDKINISAKDLEIATRQPTIWQALNATWSFDLAYSNRPLNESEASKVCKKLRDYPVARLSPRLLQSIDWTKQNTWQFFESDGEYAALCIHSIQLANMLPYLYEIKLIPENNQTSSEINLTLASMQDGSTELWNIIRDLEIGETSTKTIAFQGHQYHVSLVNNKDTPSIAMLEKQLTEALRNYRAQEKLPEWYAELKNQYFIKLFPEQERHA